MPQFQKLFRLLSGILSVSALVALAMLLSYDSWYHFQPTAHHQKIGAFALMLVGGSFICLQIHASAGRAEKFKGVLLGLAFVLWGGEQFLPPGTFVTAFDSVVITIFVADMAWVILGA